MCPYKHRGDANAALIEVGVMRKMARRFSGLFWWRIDDLCVFLRGRIDTLCGSFVVGSMFYMLLLLLLLLLLNLLLTTLGWRLRPDAWIGKSQLWNLILCLQLSYFEWCDIIRIGIYLLLLLLLFPLLTLLLTTLGWHHFLDTWLPKNFRRIPFGPRGVFEFPSSNLNIKRPGHTWSWRSSNGN